MEIYPLTIKKDRYGGTYSHGEYLAWKLDIWEVPRDPFEDDVTCMMFWEMNKIPVGRGETPEAAISDLKKIFYKIAIELQKKYGGKLFEWAEAVEICDSESEMVKYTTLKFHQHDIRF